VNALAYSPDGTTLATASNDTTIRLWNPHTGTHLATLLTLPDGGWAVVTPSGPYRLAGDLGDRLWWVVGTHRFAPGELDGYDPAVRPLGPDELLPGMPSLWD
jgi:hypothetical protein